MRSTSAFLLPLLLTAPLAAQRLIALDSNRNVYELDIATAARTQIGTVSSNASTVGGFGYDHVSGKLYMSSTILDSLYVVDVTNWNAQLIGNYGIGSAVVMHGLEWDSSTNTLYGMSFHDNGLYTIDTTTGQATLVGVCGLAAGFGNLGYNPLTDVMFMTNTDTDSAYTIDRTTGLATLLGPMGGPANPHGLAFNTDNATLYLVCSATDTLYTISQVTGAATAVGALGAGNYLGLVYIPGTGRLTRAVHGCGPTTITPIGHPDIGHTVQTTVGNTTGFPFVGFGGINVGAPFCGCTVGHEWTIAVLGPTVALPIPANPTLVGVQVFIQGLDFLGTGGCVDPLLTLTDTITLTIG